MTNNQTIPNENNLKILILNVGNTGVFSTFATKGGKLLTSDVKFIVINTDVEMFNESDEFYELPANVKAIQLTKQADELMVKISDLEYLAQSFKESDAVIIICDSDDPATKSAPISASMAKDAGCFTTVFVLIDSDISKNGADKTLEKIRADADKAVLYLPNTQQNYKEGRSITNGDNSLTQILKQFDQAIELCLYPMGMGVSSFINLLTNNNSLVSLAFDDIKRILTLPGDAYMGIGVAYDSNKIVEAVKDAINSPSMDGKFKYARGAIFNITVGPSLPLNEIQKAVAVIEDNAHPDADVLFGVCIDASLGDELRVTAIASGVNGE